MFAIVFWSSDRFIPLNSSHEHGDVWIMVKLQKNFLGNIDDSEFEMTWLF